MTEQQDVWDAWIAAHPAKEVDKKPPKFFSVLHDRKQAEIHADAYEETNGPVIVVFCREDENYYIVPCREN